MVSRPASAIPFTSSPTQRVIPGFSPNAMHWNYKSFTYWAMASLGRGDSSPVRGSTWRGPAVLLSKTRADPAVPHPRPPQTCLLPPGRGSSWLPATAGKLRWTQSHWHPGLTTHSSPEDRNGHRAPPVGETIWPSLPGAKRAWVVSATQDFGLKPGSSQANLDELVTLLSSMRERPGQRGSKERRSLCWLSVDGRGWEPFWKCRVT